VCAAIGQQLVHGDWVGMRVFLLGNHPESALMLTERSQVEVLMTVMSPVRSVS
jgi:hypothetical protein